MSFGGNFAADAIRRGVLERHLQRFLGHTSIQSARRLARLADRALVEVLRVPSHHISTDDEPPKIAWRQVGDKRVVSEDVDSKPDPPPFLARMMAVM